MDVVVVLWTLLSNMLKMHHLRPQLTTHTRLSKVPAISLYQKDLERSVVIQMFQQTALVPLRTLFRLDQSLLLSKPINKVSNNTLEEFFPLDVEPILITVSWLSDGELILPGKNISLLRINGLHNGA
jgi:hypothetical protein